METNEEKLPNKVISKWDEQLEKDKAELDKQLGINPSNKEIDRVQQEIRKTLQSVLYHGYGIISAELNILQLFKDYSSKREQEPPKEVKSADTMDLMQYITNLLYTAANEGPTMGNPEFDNWVDEQINGIDEYLTQFQTK